MAKKAKIRRSDIWVESSTPSQRRSAFSVRWAAPILRKIGVKRVADVGCGTLCNLPVLRKNFDEITLVETARRCELIAPVIRGMNDTRVLSTRDFERDYAAYDAVFLISVLHIIPSPSERRRLVRRAIEKLKPGGFVVVDVPQSETYYNRRRDVMTRADGYLTRWGNHYAFYKSFYADELDAMFTKPRSVALFQRVCYPKHIIRIWQRQSLWPRNARHRRGEQ